MTIDLLSGKFKRYPVRGFGGGLNKAVSSFLLNDDELIETQNVEFGFKGAFKPRKGIRRYDDANGDHCAAGRRYETRNIDRYSKSDGTREYVIQADRYVYADDDTTIFSDVTDINPADDGVIRFSKWRDTLYLASENDSVTHYHRDETESETHTAAMQPIAKNILIFSGVLSAGGSLEASKRYYYRFTLDIQAENDFLGETAPLIDDLGTDPKYYEQFFSDTDATNKTITAKPLNGTTSQIPTWAKRLNIYRTPAMSTSDSIATTDKDTTFYFWKSVDISDLTAAGVIDDGTTAIDTSRQIFYNLLDDPPSSRFMIPHKNRMWYLHQSENKARVYFSEYLQPDVVRATSFFDINANDGEPITGAVSWRKTLIIFKQNSMHAVSGADIENAPGVPDIQLDTIDGSVGCISPQSIAQGEGGVIFLSNRGVEFFEGTKPQPLNSEFVRPLLNKIPGARRNLAAGGYILKTRKYRIAMAQDDVNPGRNSVVLEFDFWTNTWTKHIYGLASSDAFGINAFVEARLGDETGQTLCAIDTTGLVQATTTGAIEIMDDVVYEITTANGIQWSAQTKYFDCGQPDIEKTFRAVIVRIATGQSFTVAWDIDEGAATSSESLDHTGTHSWDEANLSWLGSAAQDTTHVWDDIDQGERISFIPQTSKGRRISFTFSGTATLDGTEIQGITIVYTPEGRMRD